MSVKRLNKKMVLISFISFLSFNFPVNAQQINGYYLVIYDITTGKNERLDYSKLDECKKHEAGFSRVGVLIKKCTAF